MKLKGQRNVIHEDGTEYPGLRMELKLSRTADGKWSHLVYDPSTKANKRSLVLQPLALQVEGKSN